MIKKVYLKFSQKYGLNLVPAEPVIKKKLLSFTPSDVDDDFDSEDIPEEEKSDE